MEDMECLEELDLSRTSIKELPSSIRRLKLLEKIYLNGCPNLVIDGETENCLLRENNMLHILAASTQLCNVVILNISHYKMLEEIPELPSRPRELDIHNCPNLGTLSNNPSTFL